jgi:hypothetical protein
MTTFFENYVFKKEKPLFFFKKWNAQMCVTPYLLFIPDISGFTKLVHFTDVLTGKQITYELLSAVISRNVLELNIAEVEGDAVLFYCHGPAPSLCASV